MRKKMRTEKKEGCKAAAQKAEILKALAHPFRISIFESLAEGEKTVGELVKMLDAKDANISRHLSLMRQAGLVDSRKEGLYVYYSVKLPCLVSMLGCLDEGVCVMADEKMELARAVRSSSRAKSRKR